MSHEARGRRAAARRAVYAILQDDAIEFPVLDDLHRRVARAVAIAMATKTEAAAIELAALNRKRRQR